MSEKPHQNKNDPKGKQPLPQKNSCRLTKKGCASQPLDPLRSTFLNLIHIYMLVQKSKYPQTIHQMHDLSSVLVEAVITKYQLI